jgi:hypothetical protein
MAAMTAEVEFRRAAASKSFDVGPVAERIAVVQPRSRSVSICPILLKNSTVAADIFA